MKIAVIGPGAMGLLFGSYLSQHHDVTLVGTNPAKMQSITENGVTIREMDGSERIYRPHATADTTGLSPVDLVIVQVKASASEAALTKNKALIGPDTILMTLQNGMGHETLLSRFAAREQIVIGTSRAVISWARPPSVTAAWAKRFWEPSPVTAAALPRWPRCSRAAASPAKSAARCRA